MSYKLSTHLINLMYELGVDREGRIIGTQYRLTDNGYYYGSRYDIDLDGVTVISSDTFWGSITIYRLRKLQAKSQKIYEINRINKIIEKDTIKYLSKESEIKDAIEDYKLILEYQSKINSIVKKWQGKFSSIFTQ